MTSYFKTLTSEEMQDKYMRDCENVADEVYAFIKECGTTTVGAISRKFPQHVRILYGVLDELYRRKRIDWNKNAPSPSKVKLLK